MGMDILEPVEVINKRLLEHFGRAWDDRPIWRVVYSEDEFEKRLMAYTDAGVELLVPEWREVPKYRQWIHYCYILERLVSVPEINLGEVTEKTSYEPIYIFEDRNHQPLPPKWEVCKFVVDTVYAAMGKSSLARYSEELKDMNTQEGAAARIETLEKEMFGNETEVGDALAHKEAIIVPRNYEKDKVN